MEAHRGPTPVRGPERLRANPAQLFEALVWWLRLGIQHQRILPASPQQNGAHERMHRTLKAATARPPQGHLTAPQRAFNRFRVLYNDERPHQFLGGRTPGSLYQPSPVRTRATCRRSSTPATTLPSG